MFEDWLNDAVVQATYTMEINVNVMLLSIALLTITTSSQASTELSFSLWPILYLVTYLSNGIWL